MALFFAGFLIVGFAYGAINLILDIISCAFRRK